MRAPAIDRPPAGKRPMGRRARLRLTIILLVAAAILGTALGIWLYRKSRPAAYRPGEENSEITTALDRALPADAPRARFTDVTQSAGLAEFRTFAGARTSQLPEDMGGGAAWGDFDNDGDDDLFLVSNGGPLDASPEQRVPSLLFRNQGDGTFRKVAEFPETRIIGMGAAWADYNGDGWIDLVITGWNTLILYRNERGSFVRERPLLADAKGFWTGAAWGDYDNDGRPDLYVCSYVRYLPPGPEERARESQQFGLAVPYTLNPSSYEPERNLLFHNLGGGRFEEVARKLGVDNPQGRSLSALWHDFDQDGRLDLYVANDISENKFFLNRGGRFVDAGQGAWIAEYRGSMGLAAGDWDRDGDDDLFISHWIAQQYALYNSLLADNRRLGKSTELHFMDVAEMSGIGQASLQFVGWGAEFADIDSDGWLDLAVANGSTFESKEAAKRTLLPLRSFLFWNQRGKFFHDLAPLDASLRTPHVSRGLAVADYDNDGDLDIAIVDHDGGVRLLRNDTKQGNWIEFRGVPDGATVVAAAGGAVHRRTVSSASYLSQSSRRVHVGLGSAGRADSLEVLLPGGGKRTYGSLNANRIWELGANGQARAAAAATVRGNVIEFWAKQRAAMDAMKRERNPARAAELFRAALAIDPTHEDSLYYLANCLAAQDDTAGALAQLERLKQVNPKSQRAHARWGVLRASTARSRGDLRAAEASLEKALALNPEETGALTVLGELALIQGAPERARQRLEWASRTNPRAAGALFLRAYLAWKSGGEQASRQLLASARQALGPDWKPRGSAAEGDVASKMHSDATLLSRFWESWDGAAEPGRAFQALEAYLQKR